MQNIIQSNNSKGNLISEVVIQSILLCNLGKCTLPIPLSLLCTEYDFACRDVQIPTPLSKTRRRFNWQPYMALLILHYYASTQQVKPTITNSQARNHQKFA